MQVVTTFHDTAGTMFSSASLPTSLDAADFTFIDRVNMILCEPRRMRNQERNSTAPESTS